ncbi:MAG: AraC family transcriptional regulator ligand-binding domain-containing protein [Pseudomonadota bacterium]
MPRTLDDAVAAGPSVADGSSGRFGTIKPNPMLAILDYAIKHGVPHDYLSEIVGRPIDNIAPDTTLPAVVGPALLGQLVERGIGVAPAMEIAETAPFSFFGGLERAVLLAPTGGDALQALAANFAVFHDRLVANFEQSASYAEFSFGHTLQEPDNGACNQVVMGVLVRLMRSAFGPYGRPCEVRMRSDRNGVRAAYSDFFGVPIEFNHENGGYGLVFRRSDMEWRQPGHDAAVFEFALSRLEKAAELRRARTPTADYLELINAATLCASEGVFNVTSVAATAGLGERTAQRIAQRHGTSLGRLVDKARLKVLRDQICKDAKTSAEDLSRLAGFSDGRALRRALKTWTGETLSQFRASNQYATDALVSK